MPLSHFAVDEQGIDKSDQLRYSECGLVPCLLGWVLMESCVAEVGNDRLEGDFQIVLR